MEQGNDRQYRLATAPASHCAGADRYDYDEDVRWIQSTDALGADVCLLWSQLHHAELRGAVYADQYRLCDLVGCRDYADQHCGILLFRRTAENGIGMLDGIDCRRDYRIEMERCTMNEYEINSVTQSKQSDLEMPLASFQVITDTHVTDNPQHIHNLHWEQALADIASYGQPSLGIMHAGDVTDHGLEAEYREMHRIWEKYRHQLPSFFFTMGNHDVGDFIWEEAPQELTGLTGQQLLELWEQYQAQMAAEASQLNQDYSAAADELWQRRIGNFNEATGTAGSYYDRWLGGYHFIFIGTEKPLSKDCHLSAVQLEWLDSTLAASTEQTRPIFLFLHQPLMNTVAGSLEEQGWYGVHQDEALRRILSGYPQVILFTGHTHWQLGSPHTMYDGQGVLPAMFNASSVGYLWTDADEYLEGSEGYYVDIYERHVRVRGRNFVTGTWIEQADYTVAYPSGAMVTE